MSIKLIIDPGSTHMSKLPYAKEIIDRAADMGAYAVKFQLFNEVFARSGNIPVPREWWPILKAHAGNRIILTASVFDEEGLALLLEACPAFIKFAFSQKEKVGWIRSVIEREILPIISCDVMTERELPLGVHKLYCIPEYPVPYEINFDGIFPRFDGFSSHAMGTRQDERAIHAGARMIEKHMTLNHVDIDCPDSFFALKPAEMERLALICGNST